MSTWASTAGPSLMPCCPCCCVTPTAARNSACCSTAFIGGAYAIAAAAVHHARHHRSIACKKLSCTHATLAEPWCSCRSNTILPTPAHTAHTGHMRGHMCVASTPEGWSVALRIPEKGKPFCKTSIASKVAQGDIIRATQPPQRIMYVPFNPCIAVCAKSMRASSWPFKP